MSLGRYCLIMAIGSLITIVFQIARKDETETVGEGG